MTYVFGALAAALVIIYMARPNFRRAILIYENQAWSDILMRPAGTLLLLIIVATLVGPFLFRRRKAEPAHVPTAAM